ncbi:hypothetical protein [Sorangium sp. So ce131]|uniref:hypothetical protein n=1 Tax=Sorangium sp. So ce131 TaxID=3133282 RepID=UPI003F5EFADA
MDEYEEAYLEAEDNSNLTNTFATFRCDSLPKWMDYQDIICGVRVATFSDFSCGQRLLLGGSWGYTRPWENCAGWPQVVDYFGESFFPHHFRVWVR